MSNKYPVKPLPTTDPAHLTPHVRYRYCTSVQRRSEFTTGMLEVPIGNYRTLVRCDCYQTAVLYSPTTNIQYYYITGCIIIAKQSSSANHAQQKEKSRERMPEQGGVTELQGLEQEIAVLTRIKAGYEGSKSTSTCEKTLLAQMARHN
jgi:hypothetical protein